MIGGKGTRVYTTCSSKDACPQTARLGPQASEASRCWGVGITELKDWGSPTGLQPQRTKPRYPCTLTPYVSRYDRGIGEELRGRAIAFWKALTMPGMAKFFDFAISASISLSPPPSPVLEKGPRSDEAVI